MEMFNFSDKNTIFRSQENNLFVYFICATSKNVFSKINTNFISVQEESFLVSIHEVTKTRRFLRLLFSFYHKSTGNAGLYWCAEMILFCN